MKTVSSPIKEHIGNCLLFIHTEQDGVTHVRAFGPNGWSLDESSEDRDNIAAIARRKCMVQNMKTQG
jgi:hypothetical protein